VGLYFGVFYYAVIRNEEQDLRKRFGAEFESYAARVPLFIPAVRARADEISKAKSPENSFSWPQYRRNREYQALLGTLVGLGVVWLRMWVRARYGY
jgi:hypothetical protein